MDQAVEWSPNPITYDQSVRVVELCGRKYHKADSVSAHRYGWMERLNAELAYGRSVEELFHGDKRAFEELNKQQFAQAAVSIHNNMAGLAKIADNVPHAAFKLCMLFWNYEGEQVGTMTDELMREKVDDVMKSGVDHAFFFVQAASNVPGFLAAYRSLSPASSVSAA